MRDFASKFVTFTTDSSAIDSIRAMYDGLDSLDVQFVQLTDSVIVEEDAQTPGTFNVGIGDTHLTIVRAEDGTMSITRSTGLFAYSPEQLDLAKKTGQYKEGLTDLELAERMTDAGFADYLKKLQNQVPSNPLKLGRLVVTHAGGEDHADSGEGYIIVTNTGSEPVSGSDYKLTYYSYGYSNGYGDWAGTEVKSGKNIAAGGSVRYDIYWDGFGGVKNFHIKWMGKAKEFVPTGNEYDDYLKTQQ